MSFGTKLICSNCKQPAYPAWNAYRRNGLFIFVGGTVSDADMVWIDTIDDRMQSIGWEQAVSCTTCRDSLLNPNE